ncbi:hypothetical protein MPSEU_000886900 [Mayamaea pseudoterrestris]|nr:hypothetical protein MPSEU_000886900 [Mayamaea pseudoterrestris]
MPVIPDCIPPFEIKAPTTSGDNGAPTASLLKDAERVFRLIQDERHLTAEKLYLDVKQRLHDWKKSDVASGASAKHRIHLPRGSYKTKQSKQEQERAVKEMQQVEALFTQKVELLDRLVNRCRLFKKAKQNLSVDDDWTYACHHFGITTHYRREADKSLSVKLEGDLIDVPLFEQICVLKEVDLHYRWAPFCSSSMTIADLDKIDTIGWFLIGMPNFGIARDGCFRAIGCDCIEEDGTIVLAAQGIQDRKPNSPEPEDTYLSDDPIIQKLDIPPLPKRRGSGRMTIKKFEALITITSPTSANTRLVANVDPNMAFMPQSLLEFVMKHLAGVMLAKLQAAAKKVTKNPAHNEHAKRMRTEQDFYKVWLMTKFQSLCTQKGWVMPHVAVFDYSDKDYHRAATFSGQSVDLSTVLDNMSAISEPELHHSESNSVSGVSSASTRRSKNPLSAYLRDMEERTRRKKEEKIAESRRLAASRLKPKQIERSKLDRLDELKVVKTLRLASAPVDGDDDDNASYVTAAQDLTLSLPQRATFRLHYHAAWLRVSLLVVLLTAHSFVLYSTLVPSLARLVFGESLSHWRFVHEATITLLHLLLCGVTDYLVCFVALMYTFSSLDLGIKAGTIIKKYFADNMSFLVAGKVVAIVAFALAKAVIVISIRVLAKLGLRVLKAPLPLWTLSEVPQSFLGLGIRPEFVNASSRELSWMFNQAQTMYQCMMWGATKLFRTYPFLCFSERLIRLKLSAQEALEPYAVDQSLYSSWREEAFITARTFFTYSTAFLLLFLLLFTLTAMRSRPPRAKEHPQRSMHAKPVLATISEVSEEQEDRALSSLASSADSELDQSATRRRLFRMHRRRKDVAAEAPSPEASRRSLVHASSM